MSNLRGRTNGGVKMSDKEKTFEYDPEQESVEEYLNSKYVDATPSADESALIAEKQYEVEK